MVKGIRLSPRDFDITTDEEGIKIFREYLTEFIVKDFFNEKVRGHSILCKIKGFEIEINNYKNHRLNMFDKTKSILLNGLMIRVLPLDNAKMFYKSIKRAEKV